jgi:xylulokinase
MSCVLGIDIGTTSTIGILIRLPDRVLGLASRPVELSSPHPGWAEENPAQWWANVCAISRQLLQSGGIEASEIAAIGTTGMTPAVVLLDKAGDLLRPSIQQSDGRCGAEVAELRSECDESAFLAKTGNGINQQLVAAKLRWIARHEPQIFSRIDTVFGSYDYINWRLTGQRAIEQNWALEAGFVDVAAARIDDSLIALAGISPAALPRKILSHEILGPVSARAAAETGLAAGTPVIGGAADMIASALGAGVVGAGDVLIKFGGAVDILTATPRVRPDPRLYLDYHLVPGLFMPNGCMSTGGSVLNWFVRTLAGGELPHAQASGLNLHQWLDRLAAQRPAGSEGLTALPYFLGEKTPLHDPGARGVFEGLTLSHDIGHLWRALLESYAYAIVHHIEVLNDIGHPTRRFIVSDGGAASEVWMQIVADALQRPLQRLTGHPGSCLGAAWTAAIAVGLESDWSAVARFVGDAGRIEPDRANAAVYRHGYRRFRQLYRRLYTATASDDTNLLELTQGDGAVA